MRDPNYKSIFKYGSLYPRLTAVINEIRKYPKNPVKFGLVRRSLEKDPLFGCYEALEEAICFLEREFIVARAKIRGLPYIAFIPKNLPKCVKYWMQIYPSFFEKAYGKELKVEKKKLEIREKTKRYIS